MRKDIIKKAIDDAVNNGVVSGISAAMITKDETDFYIVGKAGVIKPYDTRPLNVDSIYDMASCTKVICTTTRVFELIEEGKLDLEDSVAKYLPDFRFPEVKIKNLLLHNAGFPSDLENKETLTKDNIVKRLYAVDLIHKPGEVMAYSDIGFIMLGFVIEAIDHKDLATIYKEKVLEPLGMDHSSLVTATGDDVIPTELSKERGLIVGVAHDRKGYLLGKDCASAGLFSSIADVSRFVRSYLYDENSLLSKETKELMVNTDIMARSYGWDKKYHAKTLYHTGFTGTSILMDFAKHEGLVMLTNRVHPTREDNGFLAWRNDLNDKILED